MFLWLCYCRWINWFIEVVYHRFIAFIWFFLSNHITTIMYIECFPQPHYIEDTIVVIFLKYCHIYRKLNSAYSCLNISIMSILHILIFITWYLRPCALLVFIERHTHMRIGSLLFNVFYPTYARLSTEFSRAGDNGETFLNKVFLTSSQAKN